MRNTSKYTCSKVVYKARSAFVVKEYVLLTAVRQSHEKVKPGGPIRVFPLEKANSFALCLLTSVIHTLHHNATLANICSSLITSPI